MGVGIFPKIMIYALELFFPKFHFDLKLKTFYSQLREITKKKNQRVREQKNQEKNGEEMKNQTLPKPNGVELRDDQIEMMPRLRATETLTLSKGIER